MEHLYGAQIGEPMVLGDEQGLQGALSMASHEFFHHWNIKRLRPIELGPWDYTRENYTKCLWVGEGMTEYYGEISLMRAGFTSREQYLQGLAAAINESRYRSRHGIGHHVMSASQSSFNAWYQDGYLFSQDTNSSLTRASYYFEGALVSVLLDLQIRKETSGQRSLDDVMRYLWKHFYLVGTNTYYFRGHGYTQDDVRKAIEAVSGRPYVGFFNRFIDGTDDYPLDDALKGVGLAVECSMPADAAADTGMRIQGVEVSTVFPAGPAETAGLSRSDHLVSISGKTITTNDVDATLAALAPGTPVEIVVTRHHSEANIKMTLTPIPSDWTQCKMVELPDAFPAAVTLREAWLKGGGPN
jgi:predicted metalloprotease with PDZ domain